MSTALVLAGGGAKGSYQANIASKLYRRKNVVAVVGVSAGALNGSVLSQGKPDRLEKIWESLRLKDVWSGGHGFARYIRMALGSKLGLYTPKPLFKRLEKEFNPNEVEVPFEAGAVSLKNGRYVPFSISPNKSYSQREVEKARKFVVASSAVPIGVEPVDVEGETLADGGIRNIAPVKSAIDYEPNEIIGVFNSRTDRPISPQENPSHVLEVGEKAVRIILNETLRADVAAAKKVNKAIEKAGGTLPGLSKIPITTIEPSEDLGSGKDFSKKAYERRQRIAEKDWENFKQ